MKIRISDIKKGISGIYKLEYPNGKIYIGQSCDIRRRISEHNNNTHEKLPPCDAAIKKYGQFEEIEILEYCNIEKLNDREKYWITYYDSNNREKGYNLTIGGNSSTLFGEDTLISVFTNEQVLDIRKRRFNGERKCDVYKDYSDKSFSTFEHVWLGRGYADVGKEYFIEKNAKTRQEYSSIANAGENNNKAKLTEAIVREIRHRYDNGETVPSIQKDYSFVSIITIKRVCKRETWKNVI